MRIGVGLLLIACAPVAACTTAMGGPQFMEPSSQRASALGYALVQPANVRSAYYFKGHLCPEPPPDVALAVALQQGAKITAGTKLDVEANNSYNTTATTLPGRDATVLVARDLMNSICILSMNDFVDQSQASAMWKQAAGIVSTIAAANKEQAEAANKNATANLVTAATQPDIDPKIAAAAKALLSNETDAETSIIGRFTRADGAVITSDLKAFSDSADVQKLLGKNVSAKLAASESKDQLADFLDGFPDLQIRLAALAKAFKDS